MLQLRQINDSMAVSPQIHVADVAEVAAAGYKSIICNRPDQEESDQPSFADIEAEAQKQGLEIRWQPVQSGQLEDAHGQEFAKLLDALPGPVFAYCRSGTRSVILWAMSQAGARPVADIVREAASAGYDIAGLAPRLEAIAAASNS